MNYDPDLTDKGTVHSYLPTYERLFQPIKFTHKSICEVGVCLGGSILMWDDFFPNAHTILGIDEAPRPKPLIGKERIRHFQGDAYGPVVIDRLRLWQDSCAVVIDDGSHQLEDMNFFIQNYSHLVARGGYLIVEDLPDPHVAYGWPAILDPMGFRTQVIDLRNIKNRHDDILFIAHKIS